MNDELKKKLTEYLTNLESAANSAGDFVVTQMPDVIQQYLAWEFYSAVFYMVINLIIVITFVILIKFSYKLFCRENCEVILLFMVVPIIVCSIFFAGNAYDAIKVSVAPKVVLLEKAANLISSNK